MAELEFDADAIRIRGDLTFATVRELHDTLRQRFARRPFPPTLRIGLSAVTNADSAGLALLIHWADIAAAASARLQFRDPPPQLIHMASIAGLEAVLNGK